MIVLNGSTEKLTAQLSGGTTTNPVVIVVSWADGSVTAFGPESSEVSLSTTTLTDLVPAPSGSDVRLVKSMWIYNGDTVDAIVEIAKSVSSTAYPLFKQTLRSGDTFILGEEISKTNPVASVFGRSGSVVAAASDYDASQIDNDSSVSGSFVDDALNALLALLVAPNISTFTGSMTDTTLTISHGLTLDVDVDLPRVLCMVAYDSTECQTFPFGVASHSDDVSIKVTSTQIVVTGHGTGWTSHSYKIWLGYD